jgi:phosphoribosylformimino-5-aminoimidazole carboxamide ribotide isomerase
MIIPAIDLINNQVVRLYQGDYQQKTAYPVNPAQQQQNYVQAGAQVMHVVDLDGAKNSESRQLECINTLLNQPSMLVQVGGGIRCEQDVIDLLTLGANRVVIGSLAVTQPALVCQWLSQYGSDKIVLALDIRIDAQGNKQLPTHGWLNDSGVTLEQLLAQYQAVGLKHVLCTDISKDGTLTGSNVALYRALCQQYPAIAWQASGGIGSLADIAALKSTGVASVIVGRALLEGKFSLTEAIACWQNASFLA